MMRRFKIPIGLGLASLMVSACSVAGAPPSEVPVRPVVSAAQSSDTGEPESFPIGQAYSEAEFWANIVPGGDNVEHYDSLLDMTRSADAVIVGTIIGIRTDPERYKGIDLQGAMFATLTVKIERVVAGAVNEAAPGELCLAIFMTDPRQYDRFAARLPNGRALLFLRNSLEEARAAGQPSLPGDDHYYRVVSDQGALLDIAGEARSAAASDPFLQKLAAQSFDSVVQLVSRP